MINVNHILTPNRKKKKGKLERRYIECVSRPIFMSEAKVFQGFRVSY